MLAPHELKNKEFQKSLRGYSTAEVDEHIAFIIEKYTELYRENDELTKRLRLTEAQLDAMKGEEEAIRGALVNAQKASSRIINEANERADVIMRSAKNSCESLVAETKERIKEENDRLREMKRKIAAFKEELFAEYHSHMELINGIAPDGGTEIPEPDYEAIEEAVVASVKRALDGKGGIISGSSMPFSENDGNGDIETYGRVRVSAETPIPDEITDEITDERSTEYSDARDAEDFSDDDGISVKRTDASAGVVSSIKSLNKTVSSDDDDEEFLRMLSNVSDGGTSKTEEFNIVYDGKK